MERCGGHPQLRVDMDEFNEFIDSCGLSEMKSIGSKFTWLQSSARVGMKLVEVR